MAVFNHNTLDLKITHTSKEGEATYPAILNYKTLKMKITQTMKEEK